MTDRTRSLLATLGCVGLVAVAASYVLLGHGPAHHQAADPEQHP